jgi:Trypsin-like peptidase domain
VGLPEIFDEVRPSIVAFISRVTTVKPGGGNPLFPEIFGTGFFVNDRGIVATNRHVIEVIEKVNRYPPNPVTGDSALGALVFTEIAGSEPDAVMGVLNVDVLGWNALGEFSVNGPWFGESVPDLGFVQLDVREVPTLSLAVEPGILRVGMAIATAGFPEGNRTVTFHEKITQITPVLRHGIISSVFPFRGAHPHGLSIDTLLQGGASGSPVFLTDRPLILGMIASKLPDTNFTVAVPSNILAAALSDVLPDWPTYTDTPRLCDLIESGKIAGEETLTWTPYQIPE